MFEVFMIGLTGAGVIAWVLVCYLSRVLFAGCDFANAGNDAIDLMGSEAVVLNTTIAGAADKGVSVGSFGASH